MRFVSTLKTVLTTSPRSVGETDSGPRSKGAFWCTDCGERIRDVDVEGEGPPSCPSCGDEMTFERSPDSASCAC